MEREEMIKCKIEFTIRLLMGYGLILEKNRRKQEATLLANTLLSECCRIILETPDDKTVSVPVDKKQHDDFISFFGSEINSLFEYLNEWVGYPVTISFGKIQLGIKEATNRIAERLLQIIE